MGGAAAFRGIPEPFLRAARACAVLGLLAGNAMAATILHLENGDEVPGEISRVDANLVEVAKPEGARNIPLRFIVAVDKDGKLINGPFSANALRTLAGIPLDDAGTPAAGATTIRASGRDRETPEYLKYGVTYHPGHMTFNPGPPGTGGSWSGGGGSMTTHYSICRSMNGEESCGGDNWIGFTGENLQSSVAAVPEAKRVADRIKLSTGIQILAVAAMPVFLFSAISMANGPKDENGHVQTHVGPGAMTLFILTGASFANYVGWSIYEKTVARKAIRFYNAGIGVDAKISERGGGMKINYGF